MNAQYVPVLSALIGAVIGGGISIIGHVVASIAQRRAELNRIIQEKRVEVYEKLIGKIEYFGIGTIEAHDYASDRRLLILDDPEKLSDWRISLTVLRSTSSHLIDSKLGKELLVLDEYVMRLESLIDRCKNEEGEYDMKGVSAIGAALYPDFQFLKKRILLQVSEFFGSGMYRRQFIPDIRARYDASKFLPTYVKELVLFKDIDKLERIARSETAPKS